ncbi:MAG: NEL-type E3 ubiquitin ligase domain-containing protein [Pseudomonadota bacterium]
MRFNPFSARHRRSSSQTSESSGSAYSSLSSSPISSTGSPLSGALSILPRVSTVPPSAESLRLQHEAKRPYDLRWSTYEPELAKWRDAAKSDLFESDLDAREKFYKNLKAEFDSTCEFPLDRIKIFGVKDIPEFILKSKHVIRLEINDSQVRELRELPPTLQTLWYDTGPLCQLPDLPETVRTLMVKGSQLSSLPRLPQSLGMIEVNNNRLSSLLGNGQSELPQELGILSAKNNLLTFLPKFPPKLLLLYLDNNRLESIPDLPPLITQIHIRNNRLTRLPELPVGINRVFASGNMLKSLPLSITNVTKELAVKRNPLSNDFLDDLERRFKSQISLNTIFVYGDESWYDYDRVVEADRMPIETTNLGIAVTKWYEMTPPPPVLAQPQSRGEAFIHRLRQDHLASERAAQAALHTALVRAAGPNFIGGAQLPSSTNEHLSNTPSLSLRTRVSREANYSSPPSQFPLPEKFKKWALLQHNYIDGDGIDASIDFMAFLNRLTETAEFTITNNAWLILKSRVTKLLDRIADDQPLRDQIFAIANEALGDCQDRIALSLSSMEMAIVTNDALRGNISQQELITLGLNSFKLQILEQKAHKIAETSAEADLVETLLTLQIQLAKPLGLISNVKDMTYSTQFRLEPHELRSYTEAVNEALSDENQVTAFFASWSPWESYIDKVHAVELREANEALAADKLRLHETLDSLTDVSKEVIKIGRDSTRGSAAQKRIVELKKEYEGLDRKFLFPIRSALTKLILAADTTSKN